MSRSLSRRRFVLSAAACVLAGAARAAPKPAAPTGLVYHPDYLLHDTGPYHPERPDRLRAIIAGLETSGLMASLLRIEPRPAADRWITTVHTPAYLGWLEAASKQAPVQLDPDTRLAPESLRVAKLAAGGVLACARVGFRGPHTRVDVAKGKRMFRCRLHRIVGARAWDDFGGPMVMFRR